MASSESAAECSSGWLAHVSLDVLRGLTRAAASLLRAPGGVVTLDEAGVQRALVCEGFDGTGTEAWVVTEAETRCQCVVDEQRPLTLDVTAGQQGPCAFAGAPLRASGRTIGALAVLSTAPRSWTEQESIELAALARAASAELERARLAAEREATTARLQRAERRYAQLMHTSYVGIFAADCSGRITELSRAAAQMLGRPLDQLIGTDFRELIAPEDLAFAEDQHRERITLQNESGEIEVRIVRSTGERRLLQVWASPVLEDGRAIGTHGVIRDVTDERAREMQLRRAERMASVAPLLTDVCHELNNPLTSIKSFAELLLLDERPVEDQEALEIVRREAHRAAKIVMDLRLVARQSQETSTGKGTVVLNDVVRQVVSSRGSSLTGIALHLDLAEELPLLRAVPLDLEQIIVQLTANAVQAMKDHAGPRKLTIRTSAEGLGVILQVTDTGPGIAAENLENIFDPFWTTRRPGDGAGLGLSLVHGIVTDLGGRVRVNSAPGVGTSFVVELPCAGQRMVSADGVDTNGNATRRLRILVVDDEAAIRYSIARYMERRGHRVHQAAEGGAALSLIDAAADDPYDVVVADLRMPGLNGGDLLCRLRERSGAWEDRLIFITGDSNSSDLGGNLGAAGIPMVQKPFELAEMAQIIETQAGITAP